MLECWRNARELLPLLFAPFQWPPNHRALKGHLMHAEISSCFVHLQAIPGSLKMPLDARHQFLQHLPGACHQPGIIKPYRIQPCRGFSFPSSWQACHVHAVSLCIDEWLGSRRRGVLDYYIDTKATEKVSFFLNRLMVLPTYDQEMLFSFFSSTLDAVIQVCLLKYL